MQSDLFYLPVNNSGNQLDSRAQRPVLGDRTNVGASCSYDTVGDIVKQRIPGASRLSTKRSSRGLALPASPLAVAHTPIPYKKARKDEATGGLTPFDFNLVITAALNPDSPMQVRRLSAKPQHVIETGAPPTESVIVLPELIKPAIGDSQGELLPELTAEDIEGLQDSENLPMWTDSLLDHIDCTPAQWIDPPSTTVGGINSTGPVQPQPAVPTSGALQAIQSLINTHPSTRIVSSPAVTPPLPYSAGRGDEHISGGSCVNCCKECVDKLTLVSKAAVVNSITIGRHCKLSALAGKRTDGQLRDIVVQTKKSLGGLKTVLMNDRYAYASQKEKLMCQNAEHVRIVLAIESLLCKHSDLEAAVRVNTLAIEQANTHEQQNSSSIARKFMLIESVGRDNVRAYKAMSAEMTVMNNTLEKLTLSR
ncbi:unnamed protein product [Boreogadus saida]